MSLSYFANIQFACAIQSDSVQKLLCFTKPSWKSDSNDGFLLCNLFQTDIIHEAQEFEWKARLEKSLQLAAYKHWK